VKENTHGLGRHHYTRVYKFSEYIHIITLFALLWEDYGVIDLSSHISIFTA